MAFLRRILRPLITFLTCQLSLAAHGQQSAEFESRFGGPWDDGARALVALSDGGFALGGWKARESDTSSAEGWVVRVDDRGRYVWDLPISNTNTEGLFALSPALDGGLIAVSGNGQPEGGSARLTKISPAGSIEWTKTYGGKNGDVIAGAKPTFDGGLVMVGSTADESSTDSVGSTSKKGWIVKIDSDQAVQWFRVLNTDETSALNDVAVTQDGAFVAVGWTANTGDRKRGWAIKVGSIGNTLWDRRYSLEDNTSFKSIQVGRNNSTVFLATASPTNTAARTTVIAGKLDRDGSQSWLTPVVNDFGAIAQDLVRRTDGSYLATANLTDSVNSNTLVAVIESEGKLQRVIRHRARAPNQAYAISHAGFDNYALAGTIRDPSNNNRDMWLVIGKQIFGSGPTPPSPEP